MITMVGNGKTNNFPGVSSLPTKASGTIIIENITRPELKRLAERYTLDFGNLSDALDINEAPRLEHRDNYDYLYIRLPSPRNTHSVAQATLPLLVVYDSRTIFIISGDRFLESLNTPKFLDELVTMPSTSASLIYILARIVDSFDAHIKSQIDAIHDVVVKMQNHRLSDNDFVSFILIEDQINNFISALTPLIPLFNRLQSDRNIRLSPTVDDMLTDVILATQQSINVCDANSKRISSIRSAYATLSNDSLNRIMKTLTIATLLIAGPNLVFSMYGMNVKLPLQWADAGFAITLSLAIIIVLLFIIWGKKRHLF